MCAYVCVCVFFFLSLSTMPFSQQKKDSMHHPKPARWRQADIDVANKPAAAATTTTMMIMMAQHPASSIQHPASSIQHQATTTTIIIIKDHRTNLRALIRSTTTMTQQMPNPRSPPDWG